MADPIRTRELARMRAQRWRKRRGALRSVTGEGRAKGPTHSLLFRSLDLPFDLSTNTED